MDEWARHRRGDFLNPISGGENRVKFLTPALVVVRQIEVSDIAGDDGIVFARPVTNFLNRR
ncbi:MAG: hypothetical protein EPO26_10810 [Chloroflexota bacterium]|nr:MAG: hypothetical protein EPO26_10810 [Chloroflexota bacterium]